MDKFLVLIGWRPPPDANYEGFDVRRWKTWAVLTIALVVSAGLDRLRS